MLLILKIFFFTFLFLFLLIYSLWYIFYITYNYYKKVKMKFKDWKNIYELNPNRWEIDKIHFLDDIKRITHVSESCMVYFGYFDSLKYLWYYFFIIKANKTAKNKIYRQNENNRIIKNIINYAQEDINRLKKQSEEEIISSQNLQKEKIDDWKYIY